MIFQQFLRLQDQFIEQASSLFGLRYQRFHHQRTERLQRHIVRRGAVELLVSAFHHQQMAVLHPGMKPHPVVPQFLLKVLNQHIRLFCCDMPCRMILQDISFRTNQIATHCHLARLQIDTDAGSLEWSAPFVYFRKIVSQDRHIGYFTSRMEPVGYGYQPSVPSHTGQFIHIRRFCILQERLVSQRLYSPVGHSVTQYDDVFHKLLFYTFAMLIMSANTPAAVTPAPAPYP